MKVLALQGTAHASAVVFHTTGLLIAGHSGAGKSRLAHLLVEEAVRRGNFCHWVGDDQVRLSVQLKAGKESIIASSVSPLTGLAEQRGVGLCKVKIVEKAVIDRQIILCDADVMERMAPQMPRSLLGQTPQPNLKSAYTQFHLPTLFVSRNDLPRGVEMVLSWLALS